MTDQRQSCGYTGHVCDRRGAVQFICRYKSENSYCVGGVRVTVRDTGQTDGTPAQVEAIRLFERSRYEQYLVWHEENRHLGLGSTQPFTFPIALKRAV